MSASSRYRRTSVLLAGFLTFWVGLLTYAVLVIAHSFARIGSYLLAAVLEKFLQDLASLIYLVAALEILRAAVIWATQGSIAGLAWIASRVSAWRGF